jgi:hypothetical protein
MRRVGTVMGFETPMDKICMTTTIGIADKIAGEHGLTKNPG